MKTYYAFTSQVIDALFVIFVIFGLNSCGDNKYEMDMDYSITLDQTELVLELGNSQRLVATIVPGDGENIGHVWTSEAPQIATVDETGFVTARNVGKTKIVARLLSNKATAVCEVNVVEKIIPIQRIELSSAKESIALGDEIRLSAAITPSNATDKTIDWISHNSEIATVSADGLVKAVGIGSTVIKASAGSKSAQCQITVSERTVIFNDIKCSSDESSIQIKGEFECVGVEITELGICWSKDKAPTVEDSHQKVTAKSPFLSEIKGLTPKTSYYIRAYVRSNDRIYYSATVEKATLQEFIAKFNLIESYKSVYNDENVYSLEISSPILEGYESGMSCCYGVAPNPEITDNIAPFNQGSDFCIYKLKNLNAGQTYYIRAFNLKNNKPVYYPGEGEFSTIGKEVKLDAIYTGGIRTAQIWPYTIKYTLPDNGDIYSVELSSVYKASIGKTTSDINSKRLNVKGGAGSLYVKMEHWHYYDTGWNGSASLKFTNMSTGTRYIITFGDYNRGF